MTFRDPDFQLSTQCLKTQFSYRSVYFDYHIKATSIRRFTNGVSPQLPTNYCEYHNSESHHNQNFTSLSGMKKSSALLCIAIALIFESPYYTVFSEADGERYSGMRQYLRMAQYCLFEDNIQVVSYIFVQVNIGRSQGNTHTVGQIMTE